MRVKHGLCININIIDGVELAPVKCIEAPHPPPPPRSLGCCPFYCGGSVVVDLLLYVPPLFHGAICWSLLCYALIVVLSSFAIILTVQEELVALLWLSFSCHVTGNVL